MASNTIIFVDGKKTELNQNTYLASGGEGDIHIKNGIAYKIYHDPSKMIPAGKIQELSKISLPNVLGPKKVIFNTHNKEIGFTMPYVANTEFLTRLFVSTFRSAENITPTMIKELVKDMQLTMKALHDQYQVLIVDFNNMNELVSKNYTQSYFIDVDSYQIGQYPATALMDSVRDRKVKNNQFTINSDYFSFAVTACETYLGVHPFKGIHPDYKSKDWAAKMDNNISIFDSKCKLPPNAQDFSVIPPAHRKWLEGVLQYGDRSEPPLPDFVVAQAATPQVIFGTETFEINPVRKYDGKVLAVRFVLGVCFTQTINGFYMDDKKLDSLSVSDSGVKYDFCAVQGDNLPVRLTYRNSIKELEITSLDKQVDEKIPVNNFFVVNDRIYVVQHERLIEFFPSKVGYKTILGRQIVGNVFQNSIIGEAVIAQNIIGKSWFNFPQHAGTTISIPIKELDKYRIIQIKRIKNIIVGIGEMGGRNDRFVIVFDKEFKNYNIRVEEDANSLEVNFVQLDKGVTVAQKGDQAELFINNANVKIVDKFPLTHGQNLISFGNDVYFSHQKSLFKIGLNTK